MLNISFFSYKGGAGRTSLLYNMLPFLAEELGATEQQPIIVLDLDIDSKGLTYLLIKDKENQKGDEIKINTIQVLRGDSVLGLRQQYGAMQNHPFFSKTIAIGNRVGVNDNKSILLVPAHALEGAKTLSDNNYDAKNVSLAAFKKLCQAYNCKAIVMDTSTGTQLSADTALSISNKIVTAMRITTQFRKGTEEFLRENAMEDREYIIVPNAVPKTDGTAYDMDYIMQNIVARLKDAIAKPEDLNLSLLENGYHGINEVNLFKFTEECLKNKKNLSEDEENAVRMYKVLAKEICNERP